MGNKKPIGSGNGIRVRCPEPENFSEAGLRAFRELGPLCTEPLGDGQDLSDCEVLLVRFNTQVTAELLEAAEDLQVVVTPTTGLDHIDLTSAEQHGVHIISLRGESAFLEDVPSTAEHTWALLLSLVRRIPEASAAVTENDAWRQDRFRGRELHGKTLGVLGFGRLGTMVARYGDAFGMDVVTHDPYVDQYPSHVRSVADFDAFLGTSQVLTIHVPLNEETRGMIGRRELALLPDGAYLVNTARGAIVEEAALLEALRSGDVAGAAFDVLSAEETGAPGESQLIEYAASHRNLLITPHIGGACEEAIEKTDLFVLRELERWLNCRSG